MESKSLTELLASNTASELFSGTPFQAQKPVVVEPPKIEDEKPELKSSENERIVFVGNVPLECKKKNIKRLFAQHGEVEKVWRRSIPVERGKLPVIAAVALKKVKYIQYKEGNDSCNFYVLFKNKADAQQSLELNGTEFKGKHLRVDLAGKPQQNTERTVFVGNLPFTVTDEEVWEEFKEFGEIDYVRIIRDQHSHQGKGIGYVCFKDRKASKHAIAKNNSMFQGRRLRVSKARDASEQQQQKTTPAPQKHYLNSKFFDPSKYKKQADIFEDAQFPKARHSSSLKGTKKLVRKEQVKLQEKRKQRQISNTKKLKVKKQKRDKS